MLKKLLCSGLLLFPGFIYAQGESTNATLSKGELTDFNPGYTSAEAAATLIGKAAVPTHGSATSTPVIVSDTISNVRLAPRALSPDGKPDTEGAMIVPEIKNINRPKKQ